MDQALLEILPEDVADEAMEEEETNPYWANGSVEDVTEQVLSKKKEYFRALDGSALFAKIDRSQAYYEDDFGEESWGSTAIQVTGESGQLLTFSINMYRYVIRQLLTMVTAEKPRFDVGAANIETKSLVQAKLGEDVLNHYLDRKKLLRVIKGAVEDIAVTGTGFLEVFWDPSAGDTIFEDSDEGERDEYYEGDVRVRQVDFLDVIWDVKWAEEDSDVKWVAVRVLENRFDLAARYPDMADEILSARAFGEVDPAEGSKEDLAESDAIYVYRFYHDRTDAVPEGRMVLFIEQFPDKPLLDMDLPYRRIPLLWSRVSKIKKTVLGFSPVWTIQKQQELMNSTLEKIASITDNVGLPLVWAGGVGTKTPDPSNFIGDICWVESEKKPEIVNLGQIPDEFFKVLELCVTTMEKVEGLSDAVQGQSRGSLRANNMQVFQSEQSLRFNADLETAYFELFEDVGTMILEILQDFPDNDRLISVVGKNNESSMKLFAAEDLYSVTGVSVRPGSRLTRTTEGRLEILRLMSQSGVSLSPEDVVAVIEGAPLDVATGGVQGQVQLALAENEALMVGGGHSAMFTDNHLYHMQQHSRVLNSPEARLNGSVVRQASNAILEHFSLYNNQKIREVQAALGYADLPLPPSTNGGGAGRSLPPPKQPSALPERMSNV